MRGPPPFSHSDTNPVLGHVLVHSVDKTHVLVVTVELIWLFLNMLSFNFVPTLNKSLRFMRFRRSYVNLPAVVPVKVTLLLFAGCAVFKWLRSFFLQLFVSNDSAFAYPMFEHTCCSNIVNSKVGKQTKRCEIVINKYIKTKSWS